MKTTQITVDPDILGGKPVFNGTRVPIESLFGHLEKGITIEEFLSDFPSVSLEQVKAVLGLTAKIFKTSDFSNLYENAA